MSSVSLAFLFGMHGPKVLGLTELALLSSTLLAGTCSSDSFGASMLKPADAPHEGSDLVWRLAIGGGRFSREQGSMSDDWMATARMQRVACRGARSAWSSSRVQAA
jgi:hypothetical protein